MMTPIRVLQVVTHMGRGGLESMLMNYYRHIDRERVQFDFLVHRQERAAFDDEIESLGGKLYRLPRLVPWSEGYLAALNHFFDEHPEYKIVHVHQDCLSSVILRAAAQHNIPVRIAHSHNTALRKSPLRWAKMLLHRMGRRYLGRYATALWACSRDAASFLFSQRDLTARGYTFIPNGIALSRFRFDPKQREAARAELGCSDGVLIGNVGRLCYQKNQEFLLDILPAMLTREPRARLLLVGEGADEEKLRSRAAALNIADRVIFYGVTGGVERLLWAMDVFAFPSRFEGLGIVAIEAQAAGLPVVCSEHIPIEALLSPETRQVPLSDAAGWAEALLTAAASETTRDSGPEVCQRFSIDAVAAMIASYYKGEQP